MRATHPADDRDRALIAQAVRFVVTFVRSPRERYSLPAATRADAEVTADAMNRTHGQHGRRAMIYAVLADGRSVPVARS
jgi:hypothetical protein